MTTYWMIRGVLCLVVGVLTLGLAVWSREPLYVLGTLMFLGLGTLDVWLSVSHSREDEERERTAPSRVEAATAGLESARARQDDRS